MEHAFELPRALPDRSPLDRAMAGLDAATRVDADADGRTLRMATAPGRGELPSCLRQAGPPAQPPRLRPLPSTCCGGCSG